MYKYKAFVSKLTFFAHVDTEIVEHVCAYITQACFIVRGIAVLVLDSTDGPDT